MPRTRADLPETLPETGRARADAAVPRSSAEEVGDVDPDAGSFGIGQPATRGGDRRDRHRRDAGRARPAGGQRHLRRGRGALRRRPAPSCHGENLEGIAELGAPRLIGGRGTLATDAPVKTVESYWPYASTLFDYVHRAMPMNAPGSLSADEVYAVSAYILGRAGIVGEDFELSLGTIGEVEMPNARGFIEDSRPDVQ